MLQTILLIAFLAYAAIAVCLYENLVHDRTWMAPEQTDDLRRLTLDDKINLIIFCIFWLPMLGKEIFNQKRFAKQMKTDL